MALGLRRKDKEIFFHRRGHRGFFLLPNLTKEYKRDDWVKTLSPSGIN
jgi:hypothetical protein